MPPAKQLQQQTMQLNRGSSNNKRPGDACVEVAPRSAEEVLHAAAVVHQRRVVQQLVVVKHNGNLRAAGHCAVVEFARFESRPRFDAGKQPRGLPVNERKHDRQSLSACASDHLRNHRRRKRPLLRGWTAQRQRAAGDRVLAQKKQQRQNHPANAHNLHIALRLSTRQIAKPTTNANLNTESCLKSTS